MKFDIIGRPEFWFTLNVKQVTAIIACSQLHYDGVCKDASRPGGFVFGWLNCARARTKVSATWREIDTALKIMEHPPKQHAEMAANLFMCFSRMLNMARNRTENWEFTNLETKEPE